MRVLASAGVSPWTVLLVALGLAMFLEGLPWFVSPAAMRRFFQQLSQMTDTTLRAIGMTLMSLGLALAYLSLH